MKIIGLFGPTGSGKSSQGKIMASWSGWAWVSTGELLRREGNDEILKQLFTSKLIDDMYVTKLLLAELKKVEADGVKVVVIDGYPRNAKQVSIMTENGLQVDMALDIKLSFDEAWARIKLRGRDTDNEAVVRERYEVYEQNMYSVRRLLEARGTRFVDIEGRGTVGEVAERIEQVLIESETR